MTLLEYVQFITSKTGKTDAAAQSLARQFIQRRYQMIYDSALWRDSLAMVSIAATSGTVTLPSTIERVVSARWKNGEIAPVEPQTLFQADPTIFERYGAPTAFSELPPVACNPQPPSPGLDADTITASSSDPSDNASILLRGLNAGVEQVEALALAGDGSSVTSAQSWDTVFTLSKDATNGTVTFTSTAGGTPLLTLWPGENERKFLRISLHELPTDTTQSLLVLGKATLRQLSDDRDTPRLRNIDNALIAYALADIYEHQRQFAKMQLKAQEAEGAMAILRDLEKNQQASLTRMIPWMDDHDHLLLET